MVPSTAQEKPKDSDQFEWVTIEQSGELVYEAPESIAAEPPPINKQQSQSSSSSPSSSVQTMSPIPAHSLAAFGLFLRLPGYAEVLLKERKHAQCLLRLVLGVTDDGEGSKFMHLHFCCRRRSLAVGGVTLFHSRRRLSAFVTGHPSNCIS